MPIQRRKLLDFILLGLVALLTLPVLLSPQASREAPAAPTATATPVPPDVPPEVADLAIQDLVRRSGIGASALRVVSAEAVQWPDACLGTAVPGQLCAQVITPGYRLILEAQGTRFQYVYHTDAPPQWLAGKRAVLVNP